MAASWKDDAYYALVGKGNLEGAEQYLRDKITRQKKVEFCKRVYAWALGGEPDEKLDAWVAKQVDEELRNEPSTEPS